MHTESFVRFDFQILQRPSDLSVHARNTNKSCVFWVSSVGTPVVTMGCLSFLRCLIHTFQQSNKEGHYLSFQSGQVAAVHSTDMANLLNTCGLD